MTENIKPCPFCGEKAVVSPPVVMNGIVRAGTIACSNLAGCFSPHIIFGPEAPDRTLEQAKLLWNSRAK